MIELRPLDRPASAEAGAAAVFGLGDEAAYRRWREAKLARYPRALDDIRVEIESLTRPSEAETGAVLAACARANMCVYRSPASARAAEGDIRRSVAAFARHFGLREFEDHRSAEADGIVVLEKTEAGGKRGFIPYSDRAIGWHTDGYYTYEGPGRAIGAMLLHCVRAAGRGGANGLLDHEIAYIRLRDEAPGHVAALMRPDAMTIPACADEDGRMRPENPGPVFAVDPATGALRMRYTGRKRNIRWRDDPATAAAVAALERILRDDPAVLRVALGPGEGVICNNALHDRSAFEDVGDAGRGRLLYRIRSYDRIGTRASLD